MTHQGTAAAAAADFEEHRSVLFGVAYRIVGQVSDAEDVVQEAWLRWSAADRGDVRDARAFLVRVVSRLAIDRLRRIKARREAYSGDWLPEPLLTGSPEGTVRGGPHEVAEMSESISMALLLVLETLSPLERAVFVLREAFGFSHAEIAEALDRSEEAVRQVAKRARVHVRERRPRFRADPEAGRKVAARFLEASLTGDLPSLLRMLSPGVTLVTDSGGAVRAPRLPVHGADNVARFFVAVAGRPLPGLQTRLAELNGAPALIARTDDGPVAATVLEFAADGSIERIYLIANPAKLAHLERFAGT